MNQQSSDAQVARDLLILACSRAKDDNHIPLPALCRYDGPMFRTLRSTVCLLAGERRVRSPQAVVDAVPGWLDIRILSAKFGLIRDEDVIPYYNLKMTTAIKRRLSVQVITALAAYKDTRGVPGHFMFAGPGAPYGLMFTNIERMFGESVINMNIARIGIQCQALQKWVRARWAEREEVVLV